MSIHRFMESRPTNFASGICSRTPRWRSGWMLARNRLSLPSEASDSLGSKVSNTPSWVSSVSAWLRSS